VVFLKNIKTNMETKINIIECYDKGLKIIASCQNTEHLKAARKYLDNFLNIFRKVYSEQYIQSVSYQMYAELYLAYDKKIESLEK